MAELALELDQTNVQNASFSSSSASVSLDAMRGAAALIVLLEHWRNALFVDFTQIGAFRLILGPLYLLSRAGHQAVVVFFVLSGYLISGTIVRSVQKKEWSWMQYFIHRLARLWIVLIPALLLGAFWDHLGISLKLAPALYGGANFNHMTHNVVHSSSVSVFLGNLAFTQGIFVPTFGSNGALWSLANEFWYYVLFPLGFCIYNRVYTKPYQIASCCALLVAIASGLTREMLLLFPIWLLGSLLQRTPTLVTSFGVRVGAATLYALVFFGLASPNHVSWVPSGILSDYVLGLATFGFVWILLGAKHKANPTIAYRTSRLAAQFSYTLYVVHTPILICLAACFAHDTRWHPNLNAAAVASCILFLILIYAYLLATVTEFQTDRIRGWLESKLIKPRLRPECGELLASPRL